jgi:ATP-dependent exoDNAse (exonuclease V) alpha subunit
MPAPAGTPTRAQVRLKSGRLTDNAQVVFEDEYLREHVTLGYAATVHSHQGVTADTCHAIMTESASRAMAYVAMTRGREHNHAYIYTQRQPRRKRASSEL